MNSVYDLTITVSSDYTWPLLRGYAVSLAMSGFRGTKLMCTRNLSAEAVKNFTDLGFKLVDFPKGKGTFFISRYAPAVEYIRQNLDKLRYVIWTDCRDVVFQSDPSAWLEKNLSPSKVVASTLGWRIKDDGLEQHWASICVTPETLEWLKEEPAICVGTIAGDACTMMEVLSRISSMGIELSNRRPDFEAGMDEGLYNYILRTPEFRGSMRVLGSQDTFSAQCGYLMVPTFERPWDVGEDGLIRPKGVSEPYTIIHQYDRDEAWKRLVQARYTDASLPSLKEKVQVKYRRTHSLRWKGRQ